MKNLHIMRNNRVLLKIIVLTLMFSSCAELPIIFRIEPEEYLFGIDFRKYSEEGFLFTPEKYTGEYMSIGLIDYRVLPGADYVFSQTLSNVSKGTPSYANQYTWQQETIKISQVMDSIYIITKSMGADALVNFSLDVESKDHTGIKNPTTIKGYRITGFAIKRLSE